MSIIDAVAWGTAVGSTFSRALTLRLGRLGVRGGMRGAVPPLPASSWRVN
jgi:hypothetical protein